jgi:hypothetical protein
MTRKAKTTEFRGKKVKPATPPPRTKHQIFPAHPPARRAALDTSITQHGVENATVWDDDGNLLDGWERESVCAEKGMTCPREVRHFDSEAAKFQFILSVNAHRRPNLNQKQKQSVVEAYLQGDPDVADNTLGETIGVSNNTILAVRQRLEASGTIRKVGKTRGRDGKLRPVRYTKRIITNTPNEFSKALEVVKRLPDNCAGRTLDITTAKRRARRNSKKEERESRIIPPLPGDSIQIHHCRFQELEERASIQPGTVRLITTDIPYGAEFLDQLDDLGKFAHRVLADGGLFVCMCGHVYLNQVVRVFDKYLTWRWALASTWDGDGNLYHPLDVTNLWKPILVYSKGDWHHRGRWPDVIRDNSKEKEWHHWQQPLEVFERQVRYFSAPGDLVVDPLGGGFTAAEACLRLSRRFIGCDEQAECVSNGIERLQQARSSLTLAVSRGRCPHRQEVR